MTMAAKTYSELIKLPTFRERFNYLALHGVVGSATFSGLRYWNQRFYQSDEWHRVRREVIVRDDGCDLGISDRVILGKVYIHHLNPITPDDLRFMRPCVFDPENLITVSFGTHQGIHYESEYQEPRELVIRQPFDQCPWRSQ